MVNASPLIGSEQKVFDQIRAAFVMNRLHHAYVFSGQNKEGGSRLLQQLSKLLVCQDLTKAAPCEECASCRKAGGENHPDILTLHPEGKKFISVDAVRDLASRLSLRAQESKIKIVIIKSADALRPPAQNALLKTLEEPPGPTCFLLYANHYKSLLPTVRSRVQRLHIAPPTAEETRAALANLDAPSELLPIIEALCGSELEAAEKMLESGLEEIYVQLKNFLTTVNSASELLNISQSWSQDPLRTETAIALLRLFIRDQMALSYARDYQTIFPTGKNRRFSNKSCNEAASILAAHAQRQYCNPNKTLMFEDCLFALNRDITQLTAT